MFKKILERLLKRRHFWRYATFSEISELYTSRTLRIVAMNLGAGFASIYLFQFGYSLAEIFLFWSVYFVYRLLLMPFVAKFVAYVGPKHGIFISNLLYIPALISLALIPSLGIGAIISWGMLAGASIGLYTLCYYIDFSKVKNAEHAGKELGYMAILEKLALALSPIIGGLLALFIDPQTVMWVSAVVIAVAALPLMATSEPTRTHQNLDIKGFPWRLTAGAYRSEIGVGFDYVASNQVWGLFLAVVVFSTAGASVYLSVGTLAAATVIVGIIMSYVYGKITDTKKGKKLLTYSVLANSLIYAFRPLVGQPASALAVNVANETAVTGISLTRLKGLFDLADISGHRIIFFALLESMAIIGALLACLLFYIMIVNFPTNFAFIFFYIVTGFIVLSIATVRFPVYDR